MTSLRRTLVVVGAMLVGVAALPAAASADTGASGREYGGHVVTCAQTMGFDSEHNPGMHHGLTGWDPGHMC